MGQTTLEGHERIMVCLFSRKLSRRLFVIAALLAIGADQCATAANNDVEVIIDQATLVRLDRPAAEIVVGNPSIADVSVQSGKVLVVTGKSFGETNLIVMDADGKVVVNRRLIVQEPRTGFVTMYQGRATPDLTLRAALHAAARHRRYTGVLRDRRRADHDKAVNQPIFCPGREAGVIERLRNARVL